MAASSAISSSQEDQQFCGPNNYTFCTPQNTYVFKEKEDDGLVLKIFDEKKICFFKKALPPEGVDLFRSLVEKVDSSSNLLRYQHNYLKMLSVLAKINFLPSREEIDILTFHLNEETKYPEIIFGSDRIKSLGHLMFEAPLLPEEIDQILEAPSCLDSTQTVTDNHMLVLIPGNLSLNLLKRLGKVNCNFHLTRAELKKLDRTPESSYWVLATNILPDTPGLSGSKQEDRLSELSRKSGAKYQVPSLLEAALCAIAFDRLAEQEFPVATNCKGSFTNHVIYDNEGLSIWNDVDSPWFDNGGIIGIRRLSESEN